ncbi:MAG TPA: hypothetical protein VIJ41_04320 [Candidatus Nanopelagicales bacterium]
MIEYRDDHANTVAREQVPPKRSPSLEPAEEKVPRDQCLARVVCSSGHVFAVVRRPVRGTPALAVIAGPPGPGYYAALRPEGWRYLRGPDPKGQYHDVGEPVASLVLPCGACGFGSELLRADLPDDPRADTVEVVAPGPPSPAPV